MTQGHAVSRAGAGRLGLIAVVALATGAAPATDRCPLTAEQVSAAVGKPVKGPDSSCSFFPVDESKAFPSVAFVKQVAFACSGTIPAEADYKEKVDGLGVTAYIADRADGAWILVCRDKSPFEIRADVPPNAAAGRAAAIALAKQVLGAR